MPPEDISADNRFSRHHSPTRLSHHSLSNKHLQSVSAFTFLSLPTTFQSPLSLCRPSIFKSQLSPTTLINSPKDRKTLKRKTPSTYDVIGESSRKNKSPPTRLKHTRSIDLHRFKPKQQDGLPARRRKRHQVPLIALHSSLESGFRTAWTGIMHRHLLAVCRDEVVPDSEHQRVQTLTGTDTNRLQLERGVGWYTFANLDIQLNYFQSASVLFFSTLFTGLSTLLPQ